MPVLKGYIKSYDIVSVVERGIIYNAFQLAVQKRKDKFKSVIIDTSLEHTTDLTYVVVDVSGKLKPADIPLLLKCMGWFLSGKLVERDDIGGYYDLYKKLYVGIRTDNKKTLIMLSKVELPGFVALDDI